MEHSKCTRRRLGRTNRKIEYGKIQSTYIRRCNLCEKISDAVESGDKTLANGYRFDSLYEMIGYGVTGLYPHLEEHKEELETKIEEYINFLK